MACFEPGPNLSLVDSTRDELRFQRVDLRRIISLGRLPQAKDESASSTLNTYPACRGKRSTIKAAAGKMPAGRATQDAWLPVVLSFRPMEKVNLAQKFNAFSEHWRPKVIGELNGQEVKLVKFQGIFPWHHHEQEDELFLVWRGRMRIEFREQVVDLNEGEFLIVPHGIEHRTAADKEAEVLLFEPAATRNTGNAPESEFTAPSGVRI